MWFQSRMDTLRCFSPTTFAKTVVVLSTLLSLNYNFYSAGFPHAKSLARLTHPWLSQRWNFFAPHLPKELKTLEYKCGSRDSWTSPAEVILEKHLKTRLLPYEKAYMVHRRLANDLARYGSRTLFGVSRADFERRMESMRATQCGSADGLTARLTVYRLEVQAKKILQTKVSVNEFNFSPR